MDVHGDRRHRAAWSLTQDVLGDFLAANPHADRLGNQAVWLFLDGRGGPSLLPEIVRGVNGKPGLLAWRNGENPAVMINSTKEPIAVWTTLPGESVLVHPAADGPVALAWVSPIEGQVYCTGRVADAHPGGPDGVGWSIDRINGEYALSLARLAKTAKERADLMAHRAELVAHAPLREEAYAVTEGTVANARLQLRGDPEKPGDEVPRRWLELFGGQEVPRRGQRTAAVGRVDHRPGESAHRQSHGQSRLAASLRQRTGAISQRFRHPRPETQPSRAARHPGGKVHRVGLERQINAPADDALGRLSAIGGRSVE